MKEEQFSKLDAWFSKYFPTFSRFGARNTLSVMVLLTLTLGSVVTARFVTERQFDVRSSAAIIPCSPSTLPIGAINGQPLPIWCESPINTGASTMKQGLNSWADEFNHNLSFADIGEGYTTFAVAQTDKTCQGRAWRHAHHWIIDYTPSECEGILMRPATPFQFNNGRLVIEADMSVANPVYYVGNNGEVQFEIVVTPSESPSDASVPSNSYDIFNTPTLGCTLSSRREASCTLINGASRFALPSLGPSSLWRLCDSTQSDSLCRDRFRFEFTKNTIALFINGQKYSEQRLNAQNALPDTLLSQNIYVYFSNWGRKQVDSARFHWGRIAVNPM